MNLSEQAFYQCQYEVVERQKAPETDIPGLIRAVKHSVHLRNLRGYDMQIGHLDVRMMAGFINGRGTHMTYRCTPVTFANGGGSANHREISRLLNNVLPAFSMRNDDETHLLLIKEFLWIHPFRDGNGRVAFVLHNMFRPMNILGKTVMSLEPLPEFDW